MSQTSTVLEESMSGRSISIRTDESGIVSERDRERIGLWKLSFPADHEVAATVQDGTKHIEIHARRTNSVDEIVEKIHKSSKQSS